MFNSIYFNVCQLETEFMGSYTDAVGTLFIFIIIYISFRFVFYEISSVIDKSSRKG